MLGDLGIEWTIIGHSERRNIFGESDEVSFKHLFGATRVRFNIRYSINELFHSIYNKKFCPKTIINVISQAQDESL